MSTEELGDRITLVLSHTLSMERVSSIMQIPHKGCQLPCICNKVETSFSVGINRPVSIVYLSYIVYNNAYNNVPLLCIT